MRHGLLGGPVGETNFWTGFRTHSGVIHERVLLEGSKWFFLLRRLSRGIAVGHRKESLAERSKELYTPRDGKV